MKDYFFIAFRNVRKRGVRSWLTMLGIFIGIAAVVSLISLGQGLESAVSGQFGALSTDTLIIQGADTGFSTPGSTSIRKMTEHDEEIISKVSGVEITIPRLMRVAKLEFNDKVGFSYLASIPEDQKKREEVYNSLNTETEQGKLLGSGDTGRIIVGSDFASSDSFGKKVRVGTKLTINEKNFEVIGILQKSSTFTINSAIFMLEEDMRDLFEIDDNEMDFIAAKVSEDQIEEVGEEIARKLRKDRDQKVGEEDFEVQTPSQSLESVNSILNVINIVVIGIAMVSLLVGGIGIANTMFTSVLERRREIGVMKAIGAQNKDVLSIFIIEAALLGLIGGIVGAGIGLSLAMTVAVIANSALGDAIITINPSYVLLGGAILFSLVIGVVSGIVPAYQASKLNPVQALRGT